MSSIVKAKWVTQEMVSIKKPSENNLQDERTSAQSDEQTQEKQQIEQAQANGELTQAQENRLNEFKNAEALRKANDLVKSALKSSEEIKQKSEELGYKEGYATGYDEGLRQGLEEGRQEGLRAAAAEAELGLQEIREVIDCMNQERQAALESQEEDLLAIAFEISRKIMRQQIQEDNDVFLKIFDEVIHGDDVGLKIYLSESQKTIDFHVTKEIVEKIKKLSNKSKVIIMKEDDKIMVETDDAVIDMSLPVQLQQLNKTIQENS